MQPIGAQIIWMSGKEDVGQRGAYVAQNEQQQENSTVEEVFLEIGEAFIMNKVLLKP